MKYYKILKNGLAIKETLAEKDLNKIFPAIIEDYSEGYIYDEEKKTCFQ